MSLIELTEFLGRMGASTRTGPLGRCAHCNVPAAASPKLAKCSCNKHPIVSKIHNINKAPVTQRERQLYQLLMLQTNLLGLIMSSTGKCVGTINNHGRIRHCDAAEAAGPYQIMIKPTTKDTIPLESAGRPICQCVNKQGKTVAEIVRKNKRNSIRLADKSSAPVMAVVLPIAKQETSKVNLDDMIRESKAMIETREY